MTAMRTFTVTLSNGRTLHVTAPSSQRALLRVNRMIEERKSTVTVTGVTEAPPD